MSKPVCTYGRVAAAVTMIPNNDGWIAALFYQKPIRYLYRNISQYIDIDSYISHMIVALSLRNKEGKGSQKQHFLKTLVFGCFLLIVPFKVMDE